MLDHTSQAAAPADPILAHAPHRIGAVTLVVHDPEGVAGFYEQVIGLAQLGRDHATTTLGTEGRPLLRLRHDPAARRWSPREAGLFHTAFLLPSRGDLGAWLRHAAERGIALSGAADHLVSEAVYLADPEGNGIEVYADRPSALWTRTQDGIAISNQRLDFDAVTASAAAPWAGMPGAGCVGHVHLQAGELAEAEAFYAGLLGFQITARYSGALFYGSGGYHHQLATNIWNSRGAVPRGDVTTGLAEVELAVSASVLAATRKRFADAGHPMAEGGGVVVRDPWGTALRLVAAA